MPNKPIAISAGHYPEKQGAYNSTYELQEHTVCYELATGVYEALTDLSIPTIFVPTGTLSKKIAFINSKAPLCAVEIHLNSFVSVANGTECLYYYRSNHGEQLARYCQAALVGKLGLRDRGLVARKNLVFLSKTMCPSVITESLFLNNDTEVSEFLLSNDGKQLIIEAHVMALKEYYNRRNL